MPAPGDKAALQTFTGLLQYHSELIPNLSGVSAPLRTLEGNVEWHWRTEQQQRLDKLKILISQSWSQDTASSITYITPYTSFIYLTLDSSDIDIVTLIWKKFVE